MDSPGTGGRGLSTTVTGEYAGPHQALYGLSHGRSQDVYYSRRISVNGSERALRRWWRVNGPNRRGRYHGKIRNSDAKYRSTRAIAFWEVVKAPHFASGVLQFRIRATFPDGSFRTMAPAFTDRDRLNKYIQRWWPTYAGKERLTRIQS